MAGGGMPWREARQVGDEGEELARIHVEGLGWQVVDRNWRCRHGELDLVARDEHGDLVFCEVKTRRSARFGGPLEAVDDDKARRLRRLAWAWLADHGERSAAFRIDLIGILAPTGAPPSLEHLRAVA